MKKKFTFLVAILLIIVSFITYSPVLGNDFINFDDNGYITENNNIKSGFNTRSIIWAFTTTYFTYWHPLTWLSHMFDWYLFKDNAGGHHLINLLLHIGAVLFLFFFLNKTTKSLWLAAFAAALFALHPLRVESVAWAAERKDVLSMFFGMASIYAYAFYAEKNNLSGYFICFGLFALSLMSKPLLVTLPFILLLLDYWPLGRLTKNGSANYQHSTGRIIEEKIPFIILTIASSIVTIWAQSNVGAIASTKALPLSLRIANALISYVAYLGKIIWPVKLAVFYPYEIFPLWEILLSFLVLTAITIFVIYNIKKLPFLFVGWFWYIGTLVPVCGLVQAGMQAMADRHSYLPSVGIAIMLVWSVNHLFKREDMRKMILFPAGIAILAILAVLTWRQCGHWKNNISLYNYTIKVTKNNFTAHKNRGVAYGKIKLYQRAIDDFNEAIRLQPHDAGSYDNRAAAYINLGNTELGCQDARKACELGNCKTLKAAQDIGHCR
jgi:tetratricopeptide (TPR) repeat protein